MITASTAIATTSSPQLEVHPDPDPWSDGPPGAFKRSRTYSTKVVLCKQPNGISQTAAQIDEGTLVPTGAERGHGLAARRFFKTKTGSG